MGLKVEKVLKLANLFEIKINKMAQDQSGAEIKYPFNPDQDFLALRSKENLAKAQEVLPDNFSGPVLIKVNPNKSFAFTTKDKNVNAQLMNNFGETVKSMLADAGPVNKEYNWQWFNIKA